MANSLVAVLGMGGGGSGLKPKSIVTEQLAPKTNFGNTSSNMRGYKVLSGDCTANTLKTILSVTGKGAISKLFLSARDTTSRTHRIKITIDGTVIYDSTSAANSTQDVAPVIGNASYSHYGSNMVMDMDEFPLFFDYSLLVEYATSLTETDKTLIGYIYYTR